MKSIFFIGSGFKGAAKIAQAFPSIKFVSVESNADLEREQPDAEILLTSNSVYEADTAKIVRDFGKCLRWLHF